MLSLTGASLCLNDGLTAWRIDNFAHLEDGQKHTNNNTAHHNTQENDQQRLDERSETRCRDQTFYRPVGIFHLARFFWLKSPVQVKLHGPGEGGSFPGADIIIVIHVLMVCFYARAARH